MRDFEQDTPDWQAEPHPCPFCEVMQCGCPAQERIIEETYLRIEEHLIRGEN